MMRHVRPLVPIVLAGALALACATTPEPAVWDTANPLEPLPAPPLGIDAKLTDLPEPPTPERVRLGRWLFFDTRLSADGTIACATCHHPIHGFSEPTPVSTGIGGQRGTRKSPSLVNAAWSLYPYFFWDGRASSLEEQALGPVANPIEMGSTHEVMVRTLDGIQAYKPYFQAAFGTPEITKERVAKAIADYERTCMSGNSSWDRWRKNRDETAVSDDVKQGHALFFGKAGCSQCHVGQNFTDSTFHNLGIGWNPASQSFADVGRFAVSHDEKDRGAFKTPTLRDVALHPPYMHDGSILTLRDVVAHYDRGDLANPSLDPKIRPLKLSEEEIDHLVAFMEALTGDNPPERAPAAFPR